MGLCIGIYLVTSFVIWVAAEKAYDIYSDEQLKAEMERDEKRKIEEWYDPKYNHERQQWVKDNLFVGDLRDRRRRFDKILGKGEYERILLKHRYSQGDMYSQEMIREVAKKEGWTPWVGMKPYGLDKK